MCADNLKYNIVLPQPSCELKNTGDAYMVICFNKGANVQFIGKTKEGRSGSEVGRESVCEREIRGKLGKKQEDQQLRDTNSAWERKA